MTSSTHKLTIKLVLSVILIFAAVAGFVKLTSPATLIVILLGAIVYGIFYLIASALEDGNER